MEDKGVVITKHSSIRTKQRVGISKKLTEKNALKALRYGVTHSESKGRLHRYLDAIYFSHENANNLRVYHRRVYIFHDEVLITILDLPNRYHALADKLQSQKGDVSN